MFLPSCVFPILKPPIGNMSTTSTIFAPHSGNSATLNRPSTNRPLEVALKLASMSSTVIGKSEPKVVTEEHTELKRRRHIRSSASFEKRQILKPRQLFPPCFDQPSFESCDPTVESKARRKHDRDRRRQLGRLNTASRRMRETRE